MDKLTYSAVVHIIWAHLIFDSGVVFRPDSFAPEDHFLEVRTFLREIAIASCTHTNSQDRWLKLVDLPLAVAMYRGI